MGRWHGGSVGGNDGWSRRGWLDVGAVVGVVRTDEVGGGTRIGDGKGGGTVTVV